LSGFLINAPLKAWISSHQPFNLHRDLVTPLRAEGSTCGVSRLDQRWPACGSLFKSKRSNADAPDLDASYRCRAFRNSCHADCRTSALGETPRDLNRI
jgi:hypothetical protein